MNLYLDVDGVLVRELEPLDSEVDGGIVRELTYMDSDVDDFVVGRTFKDITWSPTIIKALGELKVHIIWLTTWEKAANTYLCPLFGWEPKEVLEFGSGGLWWKLERVLSRQDKDEPFVWIDDEILWRLGENESEYGALLGELTAPRMLVSPWPGQGLTLAQMDEIGKFVERVGVRS